MIQIHELGPLGQLSFKLSFNSALRWQMDDSEILAGLEAGDPAVLAAACARFPRAGRTLSRPLPAQTWNRPSTRRSSRARAGSHARNSPTCWPTGTGS